MSIGTFILLLFILLLLGGGGYGHFSGATWGGTYGMGGIGLGTILLIILIVILFRGGL